MLIYQFLVKSGTDMIVHDHKFIYIHIPNTGGGSIGNIVHPNLPIDKSSKTYSDVIKNQKCYYTDHKSYNEYANELGNDKLKEYFVFTFVRSPYSKTFSKWRQGCIEYLDKKYYKHWGYDGNTKLNECFYDQYNKKLFHQFVDCLYEERNHLNIVGASQLYFIENSEKINFIGKFENYINDMHSVLNLINNHIGKKIFSYQSIHINKKSRYTDEYKEYYNNKTQKKVEQIFFTEFFKFNYSYGIL